MIMITGWTGNTGSFVLKKLLDVYPASKIVGISRSPNTSNDYGIVQETLDLNQSEHLESLFRKYPFEMIVHIANIRYSPQILDMANKYKVKRSILVHTTGIYSKYRAYSALYSEIEANIFNQSYPNTAFTILRPTMIYGNERDHNMHKLIKFLHRYPVFPVFGDGSALMQPVHVEDLADAIISAIKTKKTINQSYDISGGSVVSYKEVLRLITNELGKKVVFIHIPIKLAIIAAHCYNKMFKKPLVTVEQVKRLQEDKCYSHEKAKADFDYSPRTFQEGIISEINCLKQKGLI